jgi:hypothetical protein
VLFHLALLPLNPCNAARRSGGRRNVAAFPLVLGHIGAKVLVGACPGRQAVTSRLGGMIFTHYTIETLFDSLVAAPELPVDMPV